MAEKRTHTHIHINVHILKIFIKYMLVSIINFERENSICSLVSMKKTIKYYVHINVNTNCVKLTISQNFQ